MSYISSNYFKMKNIAFILSFFLFVSITVQATVWRVNNTPGIDADFNNLSAAVSSASVVNDDTIHLEPSALSYGGIYFDKRLTVIGHGYFLDTASNPNHNGGFQALSLGAKIDSIALNLGAIGSSFIGIEFLGAQPIKFQFSGSLDPANILFESCYFASGYEPSTGISSAQNSPDNVSFRKSFFNGNLFIALSSNPMALNNWSVENCIVRGGLTFDVTPSSSNNLIRNNTIRVAASIKYAHFDNNIVLGFTGSVNYSSTFDTCIVANNIFCGINPPSGIANGPLNVNGNNLVNLLYSNVVQYLTINSFDGKYQLVANSPAIGGGVSINGYKPDCGAFGGRDPYRMSGIPNIPAIYELDFPNGNNHDAGSASLLVDFKSRSNN